MKRITLLIIVFAGIIFYTGGCGDSSTELESDICSFVNPYLVDMRGTGWNPPDDCGESNITVSNANYIQPYHVISSFDFSIQCKGSGKKYTGTIYDVEYSTQWIPIAYKLKINGKDCGRMQM